MSEITISLTDEQEKFLKEFSAKHFSGSKDNVCTNHPLHTVQTQDTRVVDPDHEDPDKVSYFASEWGEEYETMQELIKAYYKHEYRECPIEIVDFQEAYDADEFIGVDGDGYVILDENDYLEAYGIPKDFHYKVNTVFDYRTVAVFFILDEAKKYMEYQSHNLTNPRTFTIDAGYANKGEYHHFWELLFNIGKHLNSLNQDERPENEGPHA